MCSSLNDNLPFRERQFQELIIPEGYTLPGFLYIHICQSLPNDCKSKKNQNKSMKSLRSIDCKSLNLTLSQRIL